MLLVKPDMVDAVWGKVGQGWHFLGCQVRVVGVYSTRELAKKVASGQPLRRWWNDVCCDPLPVDVSEGEEAG
jgi:hypothetical protein